VKIDKRDIAFVGGAACVVGGLWAIWWPVALVAAGVGLIWLAWNL
jgi:hypothetical protein